MDGIAKAVCKNRSLLVAEFVPRFPRTDDFCIRNETNAPLFYDVRNTTLTLYDATSEDIPGHPIQIRRLIDV